MSSAPTALHGDTVRSQWTQSPICLARTEMGFVRKTLLGTRKKQLKNYPDVQRARSKIQIEASSPCLGLVGQLLAPGAAPVRHTPTLGTPPSPGSFWLSCLRTGKEDSKENSPTVTLKESQSPLFVLDKV